MDLHVQQKEVRDVYQFKVVGEVDAFTAPKLKEQLHSIAHLKGVRAEIDVSEVEYMDSTGLGVFVGFYKTLQEQDGHVKVTGLNRRLYRLFEITGLDAIIDVEQAKDDE